MQRYGMVIGVRPEKLDEYKKLHAAGMAKTAADPTTQKWWELYEPCQKPLETRREGKWWAEMEEVFHHT